MSFKAIFSLFLLVNTLAIVYAKPSPYWVLEFGQASEDATEDTLLVIDSDKGVADSQTGETPLRENSKETEVLLVSDKIRCPWPPALCGDGGFWGKQPPPPPPVHVLVCGLVCIRFATVYTYGMCLMTFAN